MIGIIILALLCIWGIYTVQQRAQAGGTFQGFKSLFALVITLICVLMLCSGNPYILGLPIVCGIGKYFSKRI